MKTSSTSLSSPQVRARLSARLYHTTDRPILGIKAFEPWMKKVEQKITEGLVQPRSLIESCEVLGMCKVRIAGFPLLNNLSFPLPQTFQDECEAKLAVLEEAAASAQKMTYHQDADDQVGRFQVRWGCVHETAKEWVARMTTLVECWNKLDGNVGELSSWVAAKVRKLN